MFSPVDQVNRLPDCPLITLWLVKSVIVCPVVGKDTSLAETYLLQRTIDVIRFRPRAFCWKIRLLRFFDLLGERLGRL